MNRGLKSLSKYSRTDTEKRKMIDDVLFPKAYLSRSSVSDTLERKKSEHERVVFKSMGETIPDDEYAPQEKRELIQDEDVCCEIDEDFDEDDSKKVVISALPVDSNLPYAEKNTMAFRLQRKRPAKYCPKCGRRYPEREIVCMDCLVHLKNISEKVNVRDIESAPEITFSGSNNFKSLDELLSEENLEKISAFDFSDRDLKDILRNIKSQAFANFNEMVKANAIYFDELPILDKIILFAKSFVKVDFKSYGAQLGYFEDNTIYIDDRQTKTLQITTLLHELSHFILKEILIQAICRLLDASKNEFTDFLAEYILNYSNFTRLIDEYAAHNVEGRFTVFGYQDYSSFRGIEASMKDEMEKDEVEITKSIGNNFAVEIKEILESFIDRDLREEIKEQFMKDVLDEPNYRELMMENCRILTRKSFLAAICMILNEGCQIAYINIDELDVNT